METIKIAVHFVAPFSVSAVPDTISARAPIVPRMEPEGNDAISSPTPIQTAIPAVMAQTPGGGRSGRCTSERN